MDFTGYVGAMPFGYNNPKILDPLAEFDLVDPLNIAGQDVSVRAGAGADADPEIPGPAGLMERLTDVSSHYDMDTVFLSNTGAEAVENAIKIAYDHTDGKYAVTSKGVFNGRSLWRAGVGQCAVRPGPCDTGEVPLTAEMVRECSIATAGLSLGRCRLRRRLLLKFVESVVEVVDRWLVDRAPVCDDDQREQKHDAPAKRFVR
jgi:hypothetical protein